MKVLLISANTEMINMPVLPLGMAFVARAAEDAGHKVSQINLMAEPEALKSLEKQIHNVQPNIIGISVRNIDDQASNQPRFLLDPVKEIISVCRQNSAAKIVLGGAGYSIFPRHALTYLDADMGIQVLNWPPMQDKMEIYHLMTAFCFQNSTLKTAWRNGYEKPLKPG